MENQKVKQVCIRTNDGEISVYDTDVFGNVLRFRSDKPIDKMLVPVQCAHCSKIYDLCEGEIIHRYMDCTLYFTPCCKRQVDDREWVTSPAFRRIEKNR